MWASRLAQLRVSRVFKRWETRLEINYHAFLVTTALFQVMFFAHWMACLWTLQARALTDGGTARLTRSLPFLTAAPLCLPGASEASGRLQAAPLRTPQSTAGAAWRPAAASGARLSSRPGRAFSSTTEHRRHTPNAQHVQNVRSVRRVVHPPGFIAHRPAETSRLQLSL